MLRHVVVVSLCLGAFAACGTGAIQSNSPADGGVESAEGGFVGAPADPNAAGESTGSAASTGSTSTTGGASTGSSSSSTGGTGTAGTTGGKTSAGSSTGSTGTGSSSGSTGTGTGSSTGAPAAGLDGAGTLAGAVQGSKFSPQSATWVVVRKQVVVTLWERANACTILSLGLEPSGGSLSMTLTNESGKNSIDAVPGTYTIEQNAKAGSTGQYAAATYQDLNSKCQSTLKSAAAASSGSVGLATVGSTYTGNFTLAFTGTDALTGSFAAVACPAAGTSTKFTCQP